MIWKLFARRNHLTPNHERSNGRLCSDHIQRSYDADVRMNEIAWAFTIYWWVAWGQISQPNLDQGSHITMTLTDVSLITVQIACYILIAVFDTLHRWPKQVKWINWRWNRIRRYMVERAIIHQIHDILRSELLVTFNGIPTKRSKSFFRVGERFVVINKNRTTLLSILLCKH